MNHRIVCIRFWQHICQITSSCCHSNSFCGLLFLSSVPLLFALFFLCDPQKVTFAKEKKKRHTFLLCVSRDQLDERWESDVMVSSKRYCLFLLSLFKWKLWLAVIFDECICVYSHSGRSQFNLATWVKSVLVLSSAQHPQQLIYLSQSECAMTLNTLKVSLLAVLVMQSFAGFWLLLALILHSFSTCIYTSAFTLSYRIDLVSHITIISIMLC